jgi:hypothetical protein
MNEIELHQLTCSLEKQQNKTKLTANGHGG